MTTVKTEIIIHDDTIGKVWQIKSDKLYFDRKTLHDYLRLVVQQSHGRKTLAYIAATHLGTLKFVQHSCEQIKRCATFVRTFVRLIAMILIATGRI